MGTPPEHIPSKELKNRATSIKEGIPVRTAGIVLLNDYIIMLFKRLNLVKDNQFVSVEDQKKLYSIYNMLLPESAKHKKLTYP